MKTKILTHTLDSQETLSNTDFLDISTVLTIEVKIPQLCEEVETPEPGATVQMTHTIFNPIRIGPQKFTV